MSIVIDSQAIVKYAAMGYAESGMDQQIEPEGQQLTQKENFLAKLHTVDRENVEKIGRLFEQTLQEQKRAGVLLIVGGVLTKPLPRPDIDLMMGLEPQKEDPKRQDYPNELRYALADFEVFKEFIIGMLSRDRRLQIVRIVKPYVEYEPNDPNDLLHEGSVVIQNGVEGGTPIEIIRSPRWEPDQKLSSAQKRPFIILVSVSPKAKEALNNPKFVPIPNLTDPANFQEWLNAFIKTPLQGFEDLKHSDGAPYTQEEMLEATRKQIRDVVGLQVARKRPLEEILKMLMGYAEKI